MTGQLIWTFSDLWTESKKESDEKWLGSWYRHSVSTSRSLVVFQRFTLSPQVTECPYQLPSHCSSLYVLLSVHKSLNAHINFPVIIHISTFYSQSTSHWMPISTSKSLFVSLRFTLNPQVTECPYQLPSHCSSLYLEKDEQWLGSWYGHSVTCGLRVKRRATKNDWEVDIGIQWLVDWE
jgi:hypothetical protein